MARQPGLALQLAMLALAGLGSACQGFAAPGGFGDEGTDTSTAPPDLPQAECDVRRYDDCDAGQKCSWVVDDSGVSEPRCVPLLGELEAGEACTTIGESDDCANHHICWGTDAEGQGTCVDYCSTGLACESADDVCSVSDGGDLFLCLAQCDPVAQDCAEGWGCYPDANKRWACDRDRSGETGTHGDPCTCLNCCDPGLICMAGMLVIDEDCGPEGAENCCGEICDLDDPQPPEDVCPVEGEWCRPFYDADEVIQGYEKVGVCED